MVPTDIPQRIHMRVALKRLDVVEQANPDEIDDFTASLIIVSIVFYTFLCYLIIGMEMGVVPSFVQNRLGYGAVVAGVAVSVQYVCTLLTRTVVGKMNDVIGPKRTVLRGSVGGVLAGALLLLAAWASSLPWLSLGLLLISRLMLGFAESCIGSGCSMWLIGRVGLSRTAQILSWNGIANYGGLSAGAFLGVSLYRGSSFSVLALLVLVLALTGWVLARRRPAVQVAGVAPVHYKAIVLQVLPQGLALALSSSSFGVIATFITLYFAANHWDHAALALSLFGGTFIGTRLIFGSAIRRFDPFEVACVSFGVQILGMGCLWLAHAAWVGVLGAILTGAGFALVFPALGVTVVARACASHRGSAIALYAAFLDLSLAICGPLAGLIVSHFGYAQVYLASAFACALAIVLALWMRRDARRRVTAAAHGT